MTDTLLEQLERLIGSEDFEYESTKIIEKLKAEEAGLETVEKLFRIIERHPLDDFGIPGETAYFIEDFYPAYLPALIHSIRRTPALNTVWMLNRCINGGQQKEELLAALKAVAANDSIAPAIRESARSFLAYQAG